MPNKHSNDVYAKTTEYEREMDSLLQEDPYHIKNNRDFKKVHDDCTPCSIVCKGCKTDRFIVGQLPYYTIIKCPNCNWERAIHQG